MKTSRSSIMISLYWRASFSKLAFDKSKNWWRNGIKTISEKGFLFYFKSLAKKNN